MKAGGGQNITIGLMCRQFLTKLDWFSTLFPRIPVPVQKSIEQKLNEYDRNNGIVQPQATQRPSVGNSAAAAVDNRRDREREIEKDLIVIELQKNIKVRGNVRVHPIKEDEAMRMKLAIQKDLIVVKSTRAGLANIENDHARDRKSARIVAENMNMMKAEALNDIKKTY